MYIHNQTILLSADFTVVICSFINTNLIITGNINNNKLASYGTDGRHFATDISANFEVT